MRALFNYITVVSSILLITTILLQARSSSLGAGFGGGTEFYHSRRGAEKALHYATIGLAVIFVLSVVLSLLARR